MSRRTKKVKSVGRFGARYGVRIRRRIQEVEGEQRKRHRCPRCLAYAVRRRSTGVWECHRCGHIFAGGAYRPIVTTAVVGEVPPAEGEEEAKPGEAA
ncbi:MAG TPA: 50S ribosomal protein L37ae [Thermoplasmata archaeon]|jgi:large subunit ribosomal protein L37Ae|nr:50S ribosomal protein L37ae [Thermoplasmata archaeon]